MSNGATPDFDHAAYQRERIRCLERRLVGQRLVNAELTIALAAYIVTSEARRQVDAMSQSEFMAELEGRT